MRSILASIALVGVAGTLLTVSEAAEKGKWVKVHTNKAENVRFVDPNKPFPRKPHDFSFCSRLRLKQGVPKWLDIQVWTTQFSPVIEIWDGPVGRGRPWKIEFENRVIGTRPTYMAEISEQMPTGRIAICIKPGAVFDIVEHRVPYERYGELLSRFWTFSYRTTWYEWREGAGRSAGSGQRKMPPGLFKGGADGCPRDSCIANIDQYIMGSMALCRRDRGADGHQPCAR